MAGKKKGLTKTVSKKSTKNIEDKEKIDILNKCVLYLT